MLIYIEPVLHKPVPEVFLSSVAKLQCDAAKFLAASKNDDEAREKYPARGDPSKYSLQGDWDAESSSFKTESISIPAFLAHSVRAICSIFPLDRYLAAHYENQMRAALSALDEKDAEYLDYLAITPDAEPYDASDAAAAFLKFQRKLYLAYAREY